jgi:polar amino acid transport system substrate-binding protein
MGCIRRIIVPRHRPSVLARVALGVALLVLLALPRAQAGPRIDDLGCDRPLRVAVFEFGPWYRAGTGITIDLLKTITAMTGCTFQPVILSRPAAWDALRGGTVDIIPNSIRTTERDRLARFVTFLRIRNLMIVRADRENSLGSIDSFVADRSARLGIIRGFRYGSYFDLRLQSLLGDDRVTAVDDPRDLVEQLRKGELDAILLPSGHYFAYVGDMDRQRAFRVLDTTAAGPIPSGFALSRGHFSGVQVDNWLRLIEALVLDRTMENLIAGHLPPRIAATIPYR